MDQTRLYYLLERQLEGLLTNAEQAELIRILDEKDMDLIVETMLPQIKRAFEQPLQIDPLVEASTLQTLIGIDKPGPLRLPVRNIGLARRWGWAAAMVILLGGGLYWGLLRSRDNDTGITKNEKNDIIPGSNKAVLTLADGRKIRLDSTPGNVLQRGNWKLINRNGRLQYEGNNNAVEMHTLSTPKGGQYQVMLPDGTQVWLNAGSSLTYPTAFTGNERTVSITGEAYFEVVRHAGQPFHVKANGLAVDVLGTNFNINAYTNESAITATLLQGSIKVSRTSTEHSPSNEQVILHPGQQAQVNKNITVENADADVVLAWKNGLFNFTGRDLPAVMRQLERWYDIQVRYDSAVPTFKFKGKMDRGVKLSEMLEVLAKMGLNVRLEGRTLVIM